MNLYKVNTMIFDQTPIYSVYVGEKLLRTHSRDLVKITVGENLAQAAEDARILAETWRVRIGKSLDKSYRGEITLFFNGGIHLN